MNYRSFASLSFSLLGILLFAYSAHAGNETVMVKSWSDEGYRNETSSNPTPETYTFYRGHFEPGKSKTLLDVREFNRILSPMENALKRQNFVKVDPDKETPDLLVIVHWGETTVKRQQEVHDFSYANGGPGFISKRSGYMGGDGCDFSIEISYQDPRYERINSELLGTSERIYGKCGKIKRDLARIATAKERYFFILEAYDFKKLLKKEKVLKWKTQFSMESKWNDYEKALLGLCDVASNYFGKNLEDLSSAQPELNGKVLIGELEVLDSYDNDDLLEFELRKLRD